MSQQHFQERHAARWSELESLIEALDRGQAPPKGAEFPERYRELCQDLALARRRRYSAELIEGLNRLALRGHQHLYKQHARPLEGAIDLIAVRFPRRVRTEWRLLLLCVVLFFGTGAVTYLAIHLEPELVYTILGPTFTTQLETMYDPASEHHLRERPSDSDLHMFGFYIRNNIGIGFRTFAAGLLLGLGSAFFLIVNGVILGGAAAHIDQVGFGATFYSFVIGHGAFELTAIALAGLAGLKLGVAILAPGRRSRLRALVEEGKRSATIVYGFTGMLVIAAFIEAFWSSSTFIPVQVKLAIGAALWLCVIGYFIVAGRGRAAR
jgi:uncharacterized membrane protein SpoIIM required for sporulation